MQTATPSPIYWGTETHTKAATCPNGVVVGISDLKREDPSWLRIHKPKGMG